MILFVEKLFVVSWISAWIGIARLVLFQREVCLVDIDVVGVLLRSEVECNVVLLRIRILFPGDVHKWRKVLSGRRKFPFLQIRKLFEKFWLHRKMIGHYCDYLATLNLI